MNDALVYTAWFLMIYGAAALLRDGIKLVIYFTKPLPSYSPFFRLFDRH